MPGRDGEHLGGGDGTLLLWQIRRLDGLNRRLACRVDDRDLLWRRGRRADECHSITMGRQVRLDKAERGLDLDSNSLVVSHDQAVTRSVLRR